MSESNETLTQITLTPPNTIQGDKKTGKITFSDIISNGKKGIYVNVNSKTPEGKQTFYKFDDNNMYVYIKYTEEFDMVFMEILENMDVESSDLLQDKFLIAGVIDKYKQDGFIKVKVDKKFNGQTFFQQIEEGKKGKKTLKNMNYEDFINDNLITNGVYSLKVCGVWRKENSPLSGFSIRVFAVLVNLFFAGSSVEENDELSREELLKTRCANIE